MTYFLGIDIGGTVIKSGLYDGEGREKAVAAELDNGIAAHVGWCERDMNAMWQLVCRTIRRVLAAAAVDPADIAGISFSAHGKGLYAVDADGEPVRNGIVSSDNRALSIVKEWKAEGRDAEGYPYGYQQLWTAHPVSLLAWMKRNEPDSYRRTRHVLMAHDWIRYKLTGVFAAEITNISGSNLYNVATGAYDSRLFSLYGIDEMEGCLPKVVGSEECVAGLARRAAEETGLREGTPVYGGFFDVVSAAVCAGLADERFVNVVMGTWTIVTWTTDRIRSDPDWPYIWSRYCVPGRYFVHEGSATSAGNLEWFVRTFMAGTPDPYARAEAMIAALPKAGTGIQFLPYLFVSNLGDDLLAGLHGLAAAHGLDQVLQAVYEGIAFSQHVHLERILRLSGRDRTLRLTGGPTRSPVWMQMVADVAEMPVEVVHVEQSGCLGAAVAAAVGAGLHSGYAEAMAAMCPPASRVEPDSKSFAGYREKYAAYRRLAAALAGLPAAG